MAWVLIGDIGRRNVYHLGDEAMAEVAIDELSSRGASGITLVATDAEPATERYRLPAIRRIGVSSTWSIDERGAMLDRAARGDIDPTSRLGVLDSAVAEAHAVLISGGGNLTTLYRHHIDERAALARIARRRGVPLVVAAQTIGPELDARDRDLVAEIIDQASSFAVRDDESGPLARELGGRPDRVHRLSDDAILLAPGGADLEAAARIATAGSGYAIASFTSEPGRSGLDRHAYLDRIVGILDEIAGSLDIDVLLVPHFGSRVGPVARGDEISDAALAARSRTGRIRAVPTVSARVYAALARGAVVSLSTRYHPVVFGPAQGIPAVGISLSRYSTVRMRGALGPLGLAPFVLGPGSWEDVPDAVREAVDRRDELRSTFEPVLDERRARQREWWDAVAQPAGASAYSGALPTATEQIPMIGAWSRRGRETLTIFDALDEERSRVSELEASLAEARAEARSSAARAKTLRSRLDKAVRRAERAENRRVVRAVDRLGAVVRGSGTRRSNRATEPDISPAPPAPSVPRALLSVLIPIYNVEEYLEECLESVVRQSLTDLEILLIDDGSTDSSPDIAQAFAERDPRVRLVRQENQGLGAVRNRGVQLARGRYLTFVDSDDVVPREAFGALVGALEKSGSDLSIGGTVRLQPDGTRRTWQWVRDLHASDHRTTLAKTPRLLRDFYTWNKVYRAEFWQRHGFRFREGVLFEDQPVITEILCRAEFIEVVAQTTYHYRLRPDDSALTGRMYSLADIRTRDEAHRLTAGVLDDLAVDSSIRDAWLWTLAEHHLPRYLKNTAAGGPAEYEAVVEMIRAVLSVDDLRRLEGISAAHRLLCHLALTQPQATVARYLDAGGSSTSNVALTPDGDRTRAELPFEGGGEAAVPRELYRVSPDEQRLVAVLDGHEWGDLGVLTLTARVGVSQAPVPQKVEARVVVAFADGARVPLPHSARLTPTTDGPRPWGVTAWYEMAISVDTVALEAEHGDGLARGGRIEVDLTWDRIQRTGVLGRRSEAIATGGLEGSMISDTARALELTWSRVDGLRLRAPRRDVWGEITAEAREQLRLQLHSGRPGFDIVFLTIKAAGVPERRHLVQRVGQGDYRAAFDMSWLEPGGVAYLTAIDEAGTRRNVHVPAVQPGEAPRGALMLSTTPGARARLSRPLPHETSSTSADPAP